MLGCINQLKAAYDLRWFTIKNIFINGQCIWVPKEWPKKGEKRKGRSSSTVLLQRTTRTMLGCIDQLKAAYDLRGFTIKNIFMDNEFECLRNDLRKAERKIELNCVAADEHVPHIERYIRHVKERCRCTFTSLNFKRLPRRLVTELACTAVFLINSTPRMDGLHPSLSPRAIMTGHPLTNKSVEF